MKRALSVGALIVLAEMTVTALGGSASKSTTFSLDAAQAGQVSVVVQFVRAYNAARLNEALTALSSDAGVSDCDYRRVRAVEFSGRAAVARWLRQRFADRDRLVIGRIYNENPDGTRVVGVEFLRRTSRTLAALGFPKGIRPKGTAKVVFAPQGTMRTFANGPVGGSREDCRPA